ncbi:TLDc domain-containing protein [Entamoeba marina]
MENKHVNQTVLINVLKEWSNKGTFNIIFDTDENGDGDNLVLHNTVMGKSNLYFIIFDDKQNVFGGYVSKKINRSGFAPIYDNNAFLFSLIRNGKTVNEKYVIKQNCSNYAFMLCNLPDGRLYTFGKHDASIKRIGDNQSYCRFDEYDYYYKKPFFDIIQTDQFGAKRIIIIQMN